MLNPFDALDVIAVGAATLLRGAGGSTALATWLAVTGTLWMLGAVQATRPGRGSAATAFVLLTLPFAFAFAVSRTGDAAWYGAALLTAALLWATRGTLRAALPAALAVGLIGTVVAAAIGPTERSIPTRTTKPADGRHGGIGQDNGSTNGTGSEAGAGAQAGEQGEEGGVPQEELGRSVLNTAQSYGSLGEGDPTIDFEVKSPQPAFWRVQVLERWMAAAGAPRRPACSVRSPRPSCCAAPSRCASSLSRARSAPDASALPRRWARSRPRESRAGSRAPLRRGTATTSCPSAFPPISTLSRASRCRPPRLSAGDAGLAEPAGDRVVR